MSVVSSTCYELLGVPVHAPRSEVARAWADRRRAALDAGDERSAEATEALCARLDEAFSVLVDPTRSRRYQSYLEARRSAPTAESWPIVLPRDPLRTATARPWDTDRGHELADAIEEVLEAGSHEPPEEDTINTLDDWGSEPALFQRTVIDGAVVTRASLPVVPQPPEQPRSMTGRAGVAARPRPRAGASGPVVPPWRRE